MITIWDVLLGLIFVVIIPVSSYRNYQKLLRESRELIARNRRKYYWQTIIVQWGMCIALMVLWSVTARDWAALGFGLETGAGFWIGTAVTVAVLAYFYLQLRQTRRGDKTVKQSLYEQFGETIPVLPHNRGDLAHFDVLSFTAGIVEEILFRGFLIWGFASFMPLWVAAGVGIVLFGLAHSYQGWKQLPPLLLISAVLMGVFLISGSLWLPMLLHVVADLLQGRLALEVVSEGDMALEIS